MFKQIRIAVLIYILLFVAAANYLASRRSTDWDSSLWVDVYPINAEGTPTTAAFIDTLTPDSFRDIEVFFAEQARHYSLKLDQPFELDLAPALTDQPPEMPKQSSWLGAVLWSLKMRWFVWRLNWRSPRPSPDIVLFARYHDPETTTVIERSGALRKGLIANVNLFADRRLEGSNAVVTAHELLHTVGASDKYDPGTNQPLYPLGYAEPERKPLHPQRKAELMAGRIALSPTEAEMPTSLDQVLIGPGTAAEIGWIDPASLAPR